MSIQEGSRLSSDMRNHVGYNANTNGYEHVDSNSRNSGPSKDTNSYSCICMKSVLFGGIDGILSSIAIISGASGGELSWQVVFVLGVSNIVANALAMGIGEYLSSKAHREFIQTQKRREQWEFKNFKESEIKEMINTFEERGMGRTDAELVVRKMAEYENFFIGLMVTEELGLLVPEDDEAVLLKDSFLMFFSFVAAGILPLLAYGLGPLKVTTDTNLYALALTISGLCLLLAGSAKSIFSPVFWLYSGLESLIMGGVCAGAAYAVGAAVRSFIDM